MNGNGVTSTSSANISTISIPAMTQHGTNGSRLAPGGAELNLLPSSSTPNGAIYRNQAKLIVKGEIVFFGSNFIAYEILLLTLEANNSNQQRVHVMQSTPTIVVSQPQSINIITSSPQLAGKVRKIPFNMTTSLHNFQSSDDAIRRPSIPERHHNEADDYGESQRQWQSHEHV